MLLGLALTFALAGATLGTCLGLVFGHRDVYAFGLGRGSASVGNGGAYIFDRGFHGFDFLLGDDKSAATRAKARPAGKLNVTSDMATNSFRLSNLAFAIAICKAACICFSFLASNYGFL